MGRDDGIRTFTARRVWNGLADRALENGFVQIEEGRIRAVGRAADLPSDADISDLGDVTLLPGLINAHVHITFCASTTVLADYLAERDAGIETLTARAHDNLALAVRAGCTTVRDLGTLNEVVFGARDAIRDGRLLGPDIIAAGEGITSYGGHCHFFGVEAEGVDEVRAAVARQHEAGADVIKIFATGGNLTPGTDPFAPQYSVEEIRGAVDLARKVNLPIAAHAHAPEGIRRAVEACVDTIEHCLFETADGVEFDERTAAAMAERGIAVVPTMGGGIMRYLDDPSLIDALPEPAHTVVSRLITKIPSFLTNFARLRELGVRVICGTDAGIPQRRFEDFPQDVSVMSRDGAGIGMGPLAALRSATSDCADALGLDDRGVLAPGKRADLVAVGGNPLEDIDALTATAFVMCGGSTVVG